MLNTDEQLKSALKLIFGQPAGDNLKLEIERPQGYAGQIRFVWWDGSNVIDIIQFNDTGDLLEWLTPDESECEYEYLMHWYEHCVTQWIVVDDGYTLQDSIDRYTRGV